MRRDFIAARFRPATNWRASHVHKAGSDEVIAAPLRLRGLRGYYDWNVTVQVKFRASTYINNNNDTVPAGF